MPPSFGWSGRVAVCDTELLAALWPHCVQKYADQLGADDLRRAGVPPAGTAPQSRKSLLV